MNGGLMTMIVLSLLPVGLLQTVASVQHGYWYARSSEFLGQGFIQTLRWLRMPGDMLFAIGAVGFVVFVFGFGYSLEAKGRPAAGPADRPAPRSRAPEPTISAQFGDAGHEPRGDGDQPEPSSATCVVRRVSLEIETG
jgi:hypothetical protein